MKRTTLSSFSSAINEYGIRLDYYHGKDILHTGYLLRLDPVIAWSKISRNAKRNIEKTKENKHLSIKRVKGTAKEVKQFRTIWFDPKDKTIPSRLEKKEIMYFAYLDQELVGGMILTPAGNNLYLHNLGSNEKGKLNKVTFSLLWYAVEDLKKSKYQYIDIGVSFRSNLYTYFSNWNTDSYPIIFNPPFIRPHISLTPFENHTITRYVSSNKEANYEIVEKIFGKNFTILPRGIYALTLLLKWLHLKKTDSIAIYKTFSNNYISRCVTDAIESQCTWTRKVTSKTKAVIVIHEFGYPYKDILNLKRICKKKNIPLIEDCAWTIGTSIDANYKVGEVGEYAIFSFSKIFSMQYGAILKGLKISDEDNWKNFGLLDFYKREIILRQLGEELPKLNSYNQKRRENWQYIASHFKKEGYFPLVPLEKDIYPAVFMIKLPLFHELYKRYLEFGVEVGRYYPAKSLFLPLHQNITRQEFDYVYGVFRGILNLCSGYSRK